MMEVSAVEIRDSFGEFLPNLGLERSRDEASGIARAWREGAEFGHDVAAVWAEAV